VLVTSAEYLSIKRLLSKIQATEVSIEARTNASPSQFRWEPGQPMINKTPSVETITMPQWRALSLSSLNRAAASDKRGGRAPTMSEALATLVSASPPNCSKKVTGTVRNPVRRKSGRSRRRGQTPRANTMGRRARDARAKR
jgi:hypothetical protein